MGFKYDKAKMSISADEIKRTLNRHGQNSKLVQESGAKAGKPQDITSYVKYTAEADLRALSKNRQEQGAYFRQTNKRALYHRGKYPQEK